MTGLISELTVLLWMTLVLSIEKVYYSHIRGVRRIEYTVVI